LQRFIVIAMSRAFVKEDEGGREPVTRYELPPPGQPGYDEAAAWALLEGANRGDTGGAEAATGYRWGEPALRVHVMRILEHARSRQNDRLEQLAERFLETTG
jgi:hypothetical protein